MSSHSSLYSTSCQTQTITAFVWFKPQHHVIPQRAWNRSRYPENISQLMVCPFKRKLHYPSVTVRAGSTQVELLSVVLVPGVYSRFAARVSLLVSRQTRTHIHEGADCWESVYWLNSPPPFGLLAAVGFLPLFNSPPSIYLAHLTFSPRLLSTPPRLSLQLLCLFYTSTSVSLSFLSSLTCSIYYSPFIVPWAFSSSQSASSVMCGWGEHVQSTQLLFSV